jgi:transcription elongation factor Elf1
MPLKWIQCPFCGESTDLKRVSPPLRIGLKNKAGSASKQQAQVLTTSIETRVHCGFCGTTFNTTSPTMKEVFGDDQVGDVPF